MMLVLDGSVNRFNARPTASCLGSWISESPSSWANVSWKTGIFSKASSKNSRRLYYYYYFKKRDNKIEFSIKWHEKVKEKSYSCKTFSSQLLDGITERNLANNRHLEINGRHQSKSMKKNKFEEIKLALNQNDGIVDFLLVP